MNAFVNKVKMTIYHIIKQLYRNKMLFSFLSDKSKVKIQVNLLTIILNANLEYLSLTSNEHFHHYIR